MTSKRRVRQLSKIARSLPGPPGQADAPDLGPLLLETMQPTETGEPWIDAEDVARRVSQRRRRRCPTREVTAALQGGSVPAADIVSAALELRAERRADVRSAGRHGHQQRDEERIHQALSSREAFAGKRHRAGRLADAVTKKTAWAVGVVAAALLTLLATGVIPRLLGQVVSGSAIEDKFRGGPAILANESLVYANGPTVPESAVIPGNYRPGHALVRALARAMGGATPAFLRLEHTKGVPVGSEVIRLVLEGNRNEPVRILNIEPVRLERKPPLGGVYFNIGGQGEADNIRILFDLDRLSPQAQEMKSNMLTGGLFFQDHTISLTRGEQVVILITAGTSRYDATYDLAIDYMAGSATQTEMVSDDGHPFQVTAPSSDLLCYKQVFTLRGDYSVTQQNRSEITRLYHPAPPGKKNCPA
jgi:hypothetical protein